jgi:hypothetical protein
MRWLSCLGVVAGVVTAHAQAEPPATKRESWAQLDVKLEGPQANCVDAEALAVTVEQALGRPVFGARRPRLRVQIRVVGVPPDLHSTVEATGEDGTPRGSRQVSVQGGCAEARSALGLILELMLQQEQARLDAAAEPAPVQSEAAAPQPTPPRPRARRRVFIDVGVMTSVGITPGASFGPGAELGLPWAALELSSSVGFDRGLDTPPSTPSRFWTLGLSTCPTLWRNSLVRIAGCAGALGGALTPGEGWSTATRDYSPDVSEPGARLGLAAIELGVRAELRLSRRLWVLARPSLWVPLTRGRLVADQGDGTTVTLHETSVVWFRAVLGLGLDIL